MMGSITTAFALLLAAVTLCEPPTPAISDRSFLSETNGAMSRMMTGMKARPSGNADADFVSMMVPHHQGAIDMAVSELRHGRNVALRRMAQEIIVTQREEIVAMRRALPQREGQSP